MRLRDVLSNLYEHRRIILPAVAAAGAITAAAIIGNRDGPTLDAEVLNAMQPPEHIELIYRSREGTARYHCPTTPDQPLEEPRELWLPDHETRIAALEEYLEQNCEEKSFIPSQVSEEGVDESSVSVSGPFLSGAAPSGMLEWQFAGVRNPGGRFYLCDVPAFDWTYRETDEPSPTDCALVFDYSVERDGAAIEHMLTGPVLDSHADRFRLDEASVVTDQLPNLS